MVARGNELHIVQNVAKHTVISVVTRSRYDNVLH